MCVRLHACTMEFYSAMMSLQHTWNLKPSCVIDNEEKLKAMANRLLFEMLKTGRFMERKQVSRWQRMEWARHE